MIISRIEMIIIKFFVVMSKIGYSVSRLVVFVKSSNCLLSAKIIFIDENRSEAKEIQQVLLTAVSG